MNKALITFSLFVLTIAAPTPQGTGGLSLGSLLGSLGGKQSGGSTGAGGLGALAGLLGGAGGAAPGGPTGGIDIGGLLSSITGPGGADSSVIIKAYSDVRDQITALDKTISGLGADSTATQTNGMAGGFAGVGKALKQAAEEIKKQTGSVDLISSINLAGPGEEVTVALERLVDTLMAKKDAIVKANAQAAVLKELNDIKNSTVDFTSAIESKLPDLSKSVASGSSSRPVAAIEKAIAAFN